MIPNTRAPGTPTQDNALPRGTIYLTLVGAAGLILAMAATTPSEPTAAGDIAKRLVLDLPSWLVLAIVAAFVAAALLLLALLVPRPRRRRRKGDEDPPEHYYEPPKITPGAVAVLLLLALLPIGLVGGMIWVSHRGGVWDASPTETSSTGMNPARTGSSRTPAVAQQPPSVTHSGAASAVLGTLAVLAAAAALGFMIWVHLGDRLFRLPADGDRVPYGFERAVSEGLEDLRLEPDPRKAIIKCYARFERVLAAAHYPRAESETPFEFMRLILNKLSLPSDAVSEITRLFEISRFSRHELHGSDRERAWQSVAAIKAAIDRREPNAPSA